MANDKNLQSVLEQINTIKWGHLQIEKDSLIDPNNKIVQIMNTDDKGYVYFFASIASKKYYSFHKKYYARLSFDDKATPQKVALSGYVCSVEAPLIEGFAKIQVEEKLYLFKFKIMKIEIIDYRNDMNTISQNSFAKLLNALGLNL